MEARSPSGQHRGRGRQIFAQAEAALDAELDAPAKKAVRTSRTIRALGEAYLADSVRRGKQPRTMEQRESKLNAHILPTIGDLPVSKWRVEHSHNVMEKGAKTIHSTRGREDLRGSWRPCASSPGGSAGWTGRSTLWTASTSVARPSCRAPPRSTSTRGCARRPARCKRDGRRRRHVVRTRRHRPSDDPAAALRHQDQGRGLRRTAARRAERPPRDRRVLRPRLRPCQRLVDPPRALEVASAGR